MEADAPAAVSFHLRSIVVVVIPAVAVAVAVAAAVAIAAAVAVSATGLVVGRRVLRGSTGAGRRFGGVRTGIDGVPGGRRLPVAGGARPRTARAPRAPATLRVDAMAAMAPLPAKKQAKRDLRSAVIASAPHMSHSAGRAKANASGFDLDLDGGADDLDGEFSRRNAA